MCVVEGRYGKFELVRNLGRLSPHALKHNATTYPRETVQVRSFITMNLDLKGMSDV